MIHYNFHAETGIFLAPAATDLDPLESATQGLPVYALPAHATHDAPPAAEAGKVAVFASESGWSMVNDLRGAWYGADHAIVQIDNLDSDVSALTRLEPPSADHALVGGQWVFDQGVYDARVAALKLALIASVDDAIGAIYGRFTRFETEYVQREAAARTFKDAGYTGDAGIWVMAFADNTGMSASQAADLIIAQADGLRTALEPLGALRMAKYGITAAASPEAAQAVHDDIVAQAMAIAAAL